MAEAHCLGVCRVSFTLEPCTTTLTRHVNPLPFVPEDGAECSEHCDEIILLAALGLKKRMEHSGAQAAVVGPETSLSWPWAGPPTTATT